VEYNFVLLSLPRNKHNNVLSVAFRYKKYTKEQEKFEDTKGVIRSLKSKKARQYNGQKKKGRMTNNDVQDITQTSKG
jgi:hypothetical protein